MIPNDLSRRILSLQVPSASSPFAEKNVRLGFVVIVPSSFQRVWITLRVIYFSRWTRHAGAGRITAPPAKRNHKP